MTDDTVELTPVGRAELDDGHRRCRAWPLKHAAPWARRSRDAGEPGPIAESQEATRRAEPSVEARGGWARRPTCRWAEPGVSRTAKTMPVLVSRAPPTLTAKPRVTWGTLLFELAPGRRLGVSQLASTRTGAPAWGQLVSLVPWERLRLHLPVRQRSVVAVWAALDYKMWRLELAMTR